MNKNMIINGIGSESVTIYEELLDYGFEDIGGFKYALVSIMPGQQKEKDSKKKKKVCRTSDSNRESSD